MMDVSKLKGLTEDSRKVKDGYLFAALQGVQVDGRNYIDAAIQNGASHVLAGEGTQLPEGADNVELITDVNPRKVFAQMAAEFYGAQPQNIVAVTGTNGKTSVVCFAEQIWQALGLNASSMGTLQGSLTTSDPVTLHKVLKEKADSGVTHLALEASSHGLHQHRLDGVKITAAGFTNLSRDHLDYHENMADYLAAKSRLFTEVVDESGAAVINVDDAQGQKLAGELACKALTYGRNGSDLKLVSVTPKAQGQGVSLEILGKTYDLTIPLVGEFQIMNALCALGLVLANDAADQDKAAYALETLKGAKGRLEYVGGHPQEAAVYVDYAHTPDALENVLNALRPHTQRKLVCLFGCGGDRDKGKRPVMGEIASRLADAVIITDDNPRSEDPAKIRAEIAASVPDAQNIAKEITGRAAAIQTAIQNLEKGDVLLIAGKGHEQGQIFATHTEPFDDVQAIKQAIEGL